MGIAWGVYLFAIPPRRAKPGGRDPRDALGRHPSSDPRRWRPAGGPVAGAQMGIEPLDAKRLWHRAVISDYSKLYHQIICSPKTAMVPRQGPVGAARPSVRAKLHLLKYVSHLLEINPQLADGSIVTSKISPMQSWCLVGCSFVRICTLSKRKAERKGNKWSGRV
jgi:hypothetical protein